MKYLDTSAELSEDGRYRYCLARRMSMGERAVLFVGLNPSTSDATEDDPTIRKCVGFASRWGYDWLYMGNLHAYRSTDPTALKSLCDSEAVGLLNAKKIIELCDRAELVIAAWGGNPLKPLARTIAAHVLAQPHCRVLRWTKDGNPWHPLYVRYETTLLPSQSGVTP